MLACCKIYKNRACFQIKTEPGFHGAIELTDAVCRGDHRCFSVKHRFDLAVVTDGDCELLVIREAIHLEHGIERGFDHLVANDPRLRKHLYLYQNIWSTHVRSDLHTHTLYH